MPDKPLSWVGSSKSDIQGLPKNVRQKLGLQLRALQRGQMPLDFKPMPFCPF